MMRHLRILFVIFGTILVPVTGATAQQAPAMRMPRDMQMAPGARSTDAPAAKAANSLHVSEQEQAAQPRQAGARGDAQSVTQPTLTMQEPENPSLHIGAQLPFPDLLAGVVRRTPYGLQDFETWAMAHNPTLAQARAAEDRANGQARQAGLYPNPSIGYDGDQIRGGSYGKGEQGAFVQQTIVLGGKLGRRRAVYREQAAANSLGVAEQRARVRASVEQAFYRALAAQAMVAARQQLLAVAEEAVTTARQLTNAGQADAPDILQAEVEAEQAQMDAEAAQRMYLRRFRELAVVANRPDLAAAPLTGDLAALPTLGPGEGVTTILSESPETQRARQEVKMARAQLQAARREAVPDITLRAGEWWSGEITEGTQRAAGPMSFASAAITLPLWNRNQGNIQAAAAEVERANAGVARTQLTVQRRVAALRERYAVAHMQAERYRTQMLPQAQRALQLYSMKYQQMASAYPQVLLSERILFALQVDYVRALEQAWESAIALQNDALTGALRAPVADGSRSVQINLPNAMSQP
jgi:cobalt-zinc-cadmium efflux system outer membrane protein